MQEYAAPPPAIARLSVCRTEHVGERWADGVVWYELQAIKTQCGYGAMDAVEVYPAEKDVVNVANMRHLFVLAEPLAFVWRR